jgi:hypothetical protein
VTPHKKEHSNRAQWALKRRLTGEEKSYPEVEVGGGVRWLYEMMSWRV